jgi:hypothetical protein
MRTPLAEHEFDPDERVLSVLDTDFCTYHYPGW